MEREAAEKLNPLIGGTSAETADRCAETLDDLSILLAESDHKHHTGTGLYYLMQTVAAAMRFERDTGYATAEANAAMKAAAT